MKITAKQAAVLNNLNKIRFKQKGGRQWATLDDKDCDYQLTGLIVKGVVAWGNQGRPVKIAEPEEVLAPVPNWRTRSVVPAG